MSFTSRMILALLNPVASATPAAPTLASIAAGTLLEVLAWLTFLGLGIALAVIDARTRRLPNRLVALLTAGGVLFFTSAAIVEQDLAALWRALAGLAISFGVYLVISLAARGGLGAGDVKLAAPVGLYLGWLGWEALAAGIVLAFVIGGVAGLALAARKRRIRGLTVPFGPFMLAAVVATAGLVASDSLISTSSIG
jgi:leader peptidase (prepilin peptidase)/N-methyltransferase